MTQPTSSLIKEAHGAILLALARFHYLTAAQIGRLVYPNANDQNRYVQRRVKQLVDEGYVLRLRALPMPKYGQAPHVFTLARKGRTYVSAHGASVEAYFRPSEEHRAAENSPFMTHRLAAIDVLVAAEALCREHPVVCLQMRTERELKRGALRVDVPPAKSGPVGEGRRVAVIPDAWFQLSVAGTDPYSIALELDRATEDQKVWREKVAAYSVWADGPYQQAFETDNLTIAVVCPDERRCKILRDWTMLELRARDLEVLAEIFLFTAASPVTTPTREFFFGNIWADARTTIPTGLLHNPPQVQQGEVVFQAL